VIPCEGDVPALSAVTCSGSALKAAAIAAGGREITRLVLFGFGLEEVMNVGRIRILVGKTCNIMYELNNMMLW